MIPRGNNDSNDLKFDFPVSNGFGELLVGFTFQQNAAQSY